MKPTTTRRQVADNVELGRRIRGLSKRSLAARMRMAESTLYSRLHCATAFTTDDLDVLGEILEVDPGEFFSTSFASSLAA